MNWDDFNTAFNTARTTFSQTDSIATDMARMLKGRLRNVGSGYALAALKNELRDFDSRTKTWREKH